MSFVPSNVNIIDKGEHYAGRYIQDGLRIEVELRFHEQGRVRLIVQVNAKVEEDIELRMPTTNAMSTKMHATALIMSAVQRHS